MFCLFQTMINVTSLPRFVSILRSTQVSIPMDLHAKAKQDQGCANFYRIIMLQYVTLNQRRRQILKTEYVRTSNGRATAAASRHYRRKFLYFECKVNFSFYFCKKLNITSLDKETSLLKRWHSIAQSGRYRWPLSAASDSERFSQTAGFHQHKKRLKLQRY